MKPTFVKKLILNETNIGEKINFKWFWAVMKWSYIIELIKYT